MLLYTSVCLRTRQDSISYSFIYIVQKLELETVDRDRGTPKLFRNYSETGEPWNSEITPKLRTVELWNYSETGDRDRDRATSEITPKLLRNYGPGLWYSEFTPKLPRNWGTVEFRNYSEIGDRGTMELLRN